MTSGSLHGLVFVVIVGAAILLGGWISARLRIASPIIYLAIGACLGFVHEIGRVTLQPEVVLLLFLPALLYWESINTSLREIRSNLVTIGLLAVGLVLVTALLVAVIAYAFGLPWFAALTLGAVLAPTDGTAALVIAAHLPRTAITILRAESLVNDGTALVLYAVSVNALVAMTGISVGGVAARFVLSYAVGVAIGLLVGAMAVGARRLLHHDERLLNSTLSLLTPFVAYLPAEALGVSGVVAVVAAGLLISQWAPPIITASMRAQSFGFWQLTTHLLNGALFVLTGAELHTVTRELGSHWPHVLALGAASAAAVMALRLLWSLVAPTARILRMRSSVELRHWAAVRRSVPLGWAGFRGGVSLAAALALPVLTRAGSPFPSRDTIIATTFIVILFILVVQGLSMPAIVRWARLQQDPREFDEELLAEQEILRRALGELPGVTTTLGAPESVVTRLGDEYRTLLGRIHREAGNPAAARRERIEHDYETATRLALVPLKRQVLFQLRDDGRIDDVVLRRIQERLDLEELRLSDAEDES